MVNFVPKNQETRIFTFFLKDCEIEMIRIGLLCNVKSVNLQFNTVGRWDDDMIIPPSDGPMNIWIDWE